MRHGKVKTSVRPIPGMFIEEPGDEGKTPTRHDEPSTRIDLLSVVPQTFECAERVDPETREEARNLGKFLIQNLHDCSAGHLLQNRWMMIRRMAAARDDRFDRPMLPRVYRDPEGRARV